MDRTVPTRASEEIELYMRTYYSLLRSTGEVQIRTLEEVHANVNSSLHPDARGLQVDMSAFIYSSLRLPGCILETERVVMGQSVDVFQSRGIGPVQEWDLVVAPARRRRSYYDGMKTLATFIASRSDIDDLIPILTAFQIEWNKLHRILHGEQIRRYLVNPPEEDEALVILGQGTGIASDDLRRLRSVWGERFWDLMRAVAAHEKRFHVLLLGGSLNDYRRAIDQWWGEVEAAAPELYDRPMYFVSSNPHSMVNVLSGFALRHEERLVEFVHEANQTSLLEEWNDIQARNVPSSKENFLYYVLKKFLATEEGKPLKEQREHDERSCGIQRVPGRLSLDIETQIVDLSAIQADQIDPRLRCEGIERLRDSNAMIVNIDYPLGMAAYLALSYSAARVGEVRGAYIMGKSATLNGVIGDVMIPNVVHDEHSKNTYLFENCFGSDDVADHLVYGTVLDNQKTVTVRGTFLQTPRYMDVFYREGYTDIEMEAGPYLSAIYEMHRPKRHPENEIINLYGLSFDLGILHYASDTPLSKGKNLGAGSLSYFGMDPTYASSLAILKRIFQQELNRLQQA